MQSLSSKTPSAPQANGHGTLRKVLDSACAKTKCDLSDLTVLSSKSDPYRLDTTAGHRDGAWLAKEMDRLIGPKQIHWRGVHYSFVVQGNVRKPDGTIYVNTDDDWIFVSEVAGKRAPWLGYIDFERIFDNRNDDPIIHRKASRTPEAHGSVGVGITIPAADELEPTAFATGFEGRQAFQFVIFGEKSSLAEVVLPIARAHEADLYLGAREISDTHAYLIAKDAVQDGRPLVVFTLTDFDPAGWQMSVSIGRKLQALRDLKFPKLKFELVPVGLTVEQVRELNLPSTPLKETEKRADRWKEAFGCEQTEIDALLTVQALNSHTLHNIVTSAFDPYFDRALDVRVREAKATWLTEAQTAVDAQFDQRRLNALRAEAATKLAEMQEAIDDLNQKLRLAGGDHFDLPPIEVPESDIEESDGRQALLRFDDNWLTATRALKDRKSYGNGNE
jgi:hypothetical protein